MLEKRPSSLSLIFHLRLRTPDCSRAQSIRHEGSLRSGHSPRKPPFTQKCHFPYERLPMKFLVPPLPFGLLSGNMMACFRQIGLVFEIRKLTDRCAKEISLRLWQTPHTFKLVIFCLKEMRNCSIVTGSNSIYVTVCRYKPLKRGNCFFSTFQSVTFI